MSKMDSWLINPQRRIGVAGLLALLVMGSLVAPLSLDMYTPAVPRMAEYFSTTNDMVNLTLVGYYLFFAIGLLAFGPLSDKYGRKSVLVVVGRNVAFVAFLFIGAIGMFMVMLPFPDYIVAVGGLMTAGIAIALVGWYALLRSKLILRGVKDDEEPESLL